MFWSLFHKMFGPSATIGTLAHWVGWNLFLALIPVGLGYLLLEVVESSRPRSRPLRGFCILVLSLTWLAFLPNACYLLTEWRHFLTDVLNERFYSDQTSAHLRLQLAGQALFFLLYSGLGVLCFVLGLRPVERVIRIWKLPFAALAAPLFLLTSYGVYLGLILRLNSWDLVRHPLQILGITADVFQKLYLSIAIIVFAALLWGLYEALDIWVDGVVERINEWRQSRMMRVR